MVSHPHRSTVRFKVLANQLHVASFADLTEAKDYARSKSGNGSSVEVVCHGLRLALFINCLAVGV